MATRRRSRPPDPSRSRFGAIAFVVNLGIIGVVLAAVLIVLALRSDDEPATTTAGVSATTVLPGTTVAVPPAASPEDAATGFLAAWANSDWSAVSSYARTDDAGQYLSAWWQGLGATAVDLALREVFVEDTGVLVVFDAAVSLPGDVMWEYGGRFELVEADGGWGVVWSESVAHPDLGPGETLAIATSWPTRAAISADDGTPLVGPAPSITVGIIPGRVEDPAEVVAALTTHTDAPSDRVESLLGRADLVADWFYPVTNVARVDYPAARPALFPIPGIAFRLEEGRAQLERPFADYFIGRTGEITAEILSELGDPYDATSVVGRSGLERAFETQLAGLPTTEIVKVADDGSVLGTLATVGGREAAPLRTTLSIDAQRAVESILDEVDLPAAIVVLDAATGGIRAAASRPLLDFDRALGGLYPPGSTFKVVVAAAALESGMTPADTVACPETLTVGGREFGNATRLRTSMTLRTAFAVSCNTAFIEIARGLEPGVLDATARRFGFENAYDAGLPSAGGSYPVPTSEVEAAAAAIGQGRVLVSPMHMASVAAAVANGSWTVPTFSGDGEADEPLDDGVLNDLRAMMAAVVTNGTGQAAAVEGRVVVGKTGTAETGDVTVPTIAWFVGFSGEYAFAVMVEGGSSGGGAAAPLAAELLRRIDQPTRLPAECRDAAAGWLEYQGGGTRDGCVQAPVLDSPRVKWRADVGIQAWLNSPIIVGNTVVVSTAGDARVAADERDGVAALRLRDGKRLWRFPAGNDVNGLGSNGDIVVATGDEGAVWALDLATGEVRWQVIVESPVFTSPLFVGDLVVVGDAAGNLRALDIADGTERWSARLDGAVRGGAATDGTVIYAAGELGDLRAFTKDGFQIWKTQVATAAGDALVRAAPTVVDDMVVVTAIRQGGPGGPGIVAYDKYVGTLRWIGTDPDVLSGEWANVRNSAAVAGTRVLFGSSLAYGLQAVDLLTGVAEWVSPETVRCERQLASPVVVGRVAYLARLDGTLSAVDVADGTVLWTLPLTVTGERATAGECEITGLIAPGAPLQATPAIAADGTIIVGSMSGMLYAIGE